MSGSARAAALQSRPCLHRPADTAPRVFVTRTLPGRGPAAPLTRLRAAASADVWALERPPTATELAERSRRVARDC